MKEIVIVGPGGLGGTMAALLARTGLCSIAVVGRPGAHIDAIRSRGLSLSGLDEFTVDVDAFDDPGRIRACDGLVLAVKAQDTPAALETTAHVEVRGFVASLQNSTAKDEMLAGVFGKDKVMGAVAIVAGERPEPGRVNWTYDGGSRFGELDGSPSERVDYMTDLFRQAGLTAHAHDAIISSTWTKMVGWIPIGLLATLARTNNAETLSDRLMATGYVNMVRELSALARAKRIDLEDFGPYHVATWNRGTVDEAVENVIRSPLASSDSSHSAFQDIQKGRRTELSACVGPVLAEATELGVALPAVHTMYSALLGLEKSL